MWTSKKWLKEELHRQSVRICDLECKVACSHENSIFIRMVDHRGDPISRYIKRCTDCNLDVEISTKKALSEIKEMHEKKLEEINSIIEKDNG
jgi:hypothetical protein